MARALHVKVPSRRLLRRLMVLILLIGFGYLALRTGAHPAARWMGCRLVDSSLPTAAPDYYVLLMGGASGDRAKAISDVYHRLGRAPVLFGSTEPTIFEDAGIEASAASRSEKFLMLTGIPQSDIEVMPGAYVTSTVEEARAITSFMAEQNPESSRIRALVVTNWSHTSRARWIFAKVAPPNVVVETYAPDSAKCEGWWQNEDSAVSVLLEYVKWIYYLKNY